VTADRSGQNGADSVRASRRSEVRSAQAGVCSIREFRRVSADANPALQQLGRRLAQARQACGLSLEEHADRLNMGREQLRALEAGHRDSLPEAVFVIAQARRVAASLGVEIDDEIAALRGSDGFQPPQASRAASQPEPQQQAAAAASSRARRTPLLALIALLALAAALIGLRQALPRRSAPRAPEPASTRPVAEAATVEPAELVLRPSQPSWLEVRSAGGTTLFRGTLERERRFPVEGEVAVLAGRPDLVLVGIGPSPMTPMGAIDDVRWRRFRADPAPPP
jgi:cytoskeletal protein RodZ